MPLRNLLMLVSLMTTSSVMAKAYVPENPNTVVATWAIETSPELFQESIKQTPELESKALLQAEQYLSDATQPGKSHLYTKAQQILKPFNDISGDLSSDRSSKLNKSHTKAHILWAKILQHRHQFEEAQQRLNVALEQDPKNINALLMKARIQIIQQQYNAAKKTCQQILATKDISSSSLCLWEVNSHLDQLSASYSTLKQFFLQGHYQNEYKLWATQLLAEMAVRLKRLDEAESWLDQGLAMNHSQYLSFWASIKLKKGKYSVVYHVLNPLLSSLKNPEDALILRIAIAEKHLKQGDDWQKKVQEQIRLKEQRLDTEHAADFSIYYSEIEPNIEKVKYWAQENQKQPQDYSNKVLLKEWS